MGRARKIDKETLYQEYINNGLTINQLAKKYRTSHGTLTRLFDEYGIHKRSNGGNTSSLDIPKDELKRLYVDEKKEVEDIAKRYGVDRGTILRHVKKHGFKTRKPGGQPIKANIAKKDLEKYYLEDGLSMNQIAKIYDVSPGTIRRRMHKYGIVNKLKELMKKN